MAADANTWNAGFVAALLDRLPRPQRGSTVVGLSGLQGSGKSTLAGQLAAASRARGVETQVLSLDDVYFGRRERGRLARQVHPLLRTRGVPGTHDVALLLATLATLRRASAARPARLPRFDKGTDTRLPPSRWRRVTRRPALIVIEGWCLGVPPEPPDALAVPVNALERREDRDGRWRRYVNDRLAGEHARLNARLDYLVMLQAPDWPVVARWRTEQEQALHRRGAPQAMDGPALRRFLMHYERISRHALAVLPARADCVVPLDRRRRPGPPRVRR
ncbi:MAG TPA: kinase [Dokdonella sp.]|uniref:kinase n=1 Tax=Dokdonella sp. TaxID=2291710 RepID=UPI002CC22D8C|nr:kinase [Dokdonella sp.]HUD43885.1 kinase [Dokdonella sp.]